MVIQGFEVKRPRCTIILVTKTSKKDPKVFENLHLEPRQGEPA